MYGKANQYWIADTEYGDGNYTIQNDEYRSECLNANDDGGLGDGHHVQLWGCTDTSNQIWAFNQWFFCNDTGDGPCQFFLEADNDKWLLDATYQDIGNGDQIQIWTPNGGPNQSWY